MKILCLLTADVSIHAPRAGRDWDMIAYKVYGKVSIHAPRAGRDFLSIIITATLNRFNPRAPCGARRCYSPPCHSILRFNPRAPCGARQWYDIFRLCKTEVSIHAPRAGRDL